MIEYQALIGLSEHQIAGRVRFGEFALPTSHKECDEEKIRYIASSNGGRSVATKPSFLEKLNPPATSDRAGKHILLTAHFDSDSSLEYFLKQLTQVYGYRVADSVAKQQSAEVAAV